MLRPNTPAISLAELPSAIILTTSRSRGVRLERRKFATCSTNTTPFGQSKCGRAPGGEKARRTAQDRFLKLRRIVQVFTVFVTVEVLCRSCMLEPKNNLLLRSDTIQSNAPLFHSWRIPWGSLGRLPIRHARRVESRSGLRGS